MTIWNGHGRTPHDTLENILSIGAMLFCLPCLCFVACTKIKSPTSRRKEETREKQSEAHNNNVISKSTEKSCAENAVVEVQI
jgi:hypothetical protein